MKKVVIIIPAYNPSNELIEIVKGLEKYEIVVINDGSKEEYNDVFNAIKSRTKIIKHKENRGKGQAIKTALAYYSKIYEDKVGIVLADADGQHAIKDIKNIANELEKTLEVVIGVRRIDKMPLKNKIGNYIIKTIINKKYKSNILDTQTGLRGIPNKYVNELINVNGERFEYETKMLEYILKNKYKVNQIYIYTIYKKNIKSKFKTFKDSLEIIKSIAINI